jgi:hypothetical protein
MLGLICQKWRLNNFGEVFNANNSDMMPQDSALIPWLAEREPWGVKFLTRAAGDDLVRYIQDLQVQFLVVQHRENLTDCCLSGHFAHVLDIWHHVRPMPSQLVRPRSVPRDHATWWIRYIYLPYLQELEQLKVLDIPVRHYTKEYLENGGEIEVGEQYFSNREWQGRTVRSEMDYRAWCTNYDEIHDMIVNYRQHV